jgi:biopolymer transport protein ExbD
MGVSVEGSGRRRSLSVDLNLVPFIDFLSCLIAFLMIAAVWVQLQALGVTSAVGEGGAASAIPPLRVHLSAAGTWVGRLADAGELLPRVGEHWDADALAEALRRDREANPDDGAVVLHTDDGVPYEAMIAALDLTTRYGYDEPQLAGGPAAQ